MNTGEICLNLLQELEASKALAERYKNQLLEALEINKMVENKVNILVQKMDLIIKENQELKQLANLSDKMS